MPPRAFWNGLFARDFSTLALETGYADKTFQALQNMGYHVGWSKMPLGGAQAIQIDWQRGLLIGGSDSRKDGCALGY